MKIILFANTDWYLYNFRRSLALSIVAAGHDVLLVSPPGRYGEKFRSLGLRWHPIGMHRRSLNPLREIAVVWRLWRIIRREKPDLVHGFTIKPAIYGAFAARIAGVSARVSSIAGMGYVFTSSDLKARLLRPIVRNLLNASIGGTHSRLILQNPDDVALVLASRWVDAGDIRLIRGSGVDCARFEVRREIAVEDVPLVVLLASRLLWDKGIREYVEAARRLRMAGRDIRFLLAGGPDEGNPASVQDSNLEVWREEGIVELLGHVNDIEVLLQFVDVMVLPSYREGLPRSLIEGAACGLGLVTTDVPGCREVVADGVDGLLVPVRDVPALVSAIARLDDDRSLCARLGAAARAKALAQFDEKIVNDATMAVYTELMRVNP